MRIAYLDCFSGISGDMFLGALVDAGVPSDLLQQTVAALGIGAELKISRVTRSGIAATKVDVYAHGEKDLPREAFWQSKSKGLKDDQEHDRKHNHEHDHKHDPKHVHDSGPKHAHSAEHTHGRHLTEICKIIEKAAISESAKALAIRIFRNLGEVEAEIHSTSIEQVHFHEVGAVDSMADIVCAAVGAEALGVEQWICSPLNVGGGTVECAHGTLPIPAPATLNLLKDAPVYSSGPQVELVTPTGAAIVKTLASRFGSFPAMRIDKAGYGAGSREFSELPNVMRLTLGERETIATNQGNWDQDQVVVLEANLDDLNPQVLAYAMERLLAEGALDVFSVPVQMKKNRAGALLTVLSKPEDADRLTKVMFAETTTLGVRRRDEFRHILPRRWESVETEWGPVRIKVANMNGTVSNYAPEYDDCRRIATEQHVPLKNVIEAAMRKYKAS